MVTRPTALPVSGAVTCVPSLREPITPAQATELARQHDRQGLTP